MGNNVCGIVKDVDDTLIYQLQAEIECTDKVNWDVVEAICCAILEAVLRNEF